MTWVTDRIAVGGGIWNDQNMEEVANVGVTHIIDMQIEFDDRPIAEPYGLQVLYSPTDDDFQPKPPELFQRGVEFALEALDDPKSKLYIHCAAGVHRAPMMTLAIMRAMGWPLKDAIELIQRRRYVVDFADVYVQSVEEFIKLYEASRPPGRRLAGLKVFIQNEAGSNVKHYHDEKTLQPRGSKQVSRAYPFPYGFVPNTTAPDGDNVDCFVITRRPLRTGEMVECEPLALMEQVEDGEEDHKILAAMPGEDVQIDERTRELLTEFVSHVFDHIPGKTMRVGAFHGREAALRYVEGKADR